MGQSNVKSLSSSKPREGVLITSIEPNRETAGRPVKINGVGFEKSQSIVVRFDNKLCSAEWKSFNQLEAIVPELNKAGLVTVSVSFDAGNSWNHRSNIFTYELTEGQKAELPPEDHQAEEEPEWKKKVREKLAKRKVYQNAEPEDQERMLVQLSDPEVFYNYYYNFIPSLVTEKAALVAADMAPKADGDMSANLQKHLKEDCNLAVIKIKLVLTDLHYEDKFHGAGALMMPFAAWLGQVTSASSYGLVHAALQVGPWILDWNTGSLVIPRACTYSEALLSMDACSVTLASMPDDTKLIRDICNKCVEWNRSYKYDQISCNCQQLVDELLALIPGYEKPKKDGALALFLKELRRGNNKYFMFLDPKTRIPTTFQTHAQLDQFCKKRKEALAGTEPETALGTKEEFALLKSFDRAFWLRHLCDDTKDQFTPCHTGCFFDDPRTTESIPINRAVLE